MKKILPAAIVLIFSSASFYGQTFNWMHKYGAGGFDYAPAVCRDASGNVYTTGSFFGTVDFNPGPAVNNLTATSANTYILKLSATGDFIWAKSFQGSWSIGSNIALDAAGNVVVGGSFEGTVDFNPGTGTFPLVNTPGIGDDIFVAKLDAQGTFLNAFKLGDVALDRVDSIKFDNFGNMTVSGNFSGTIDFDPGTGVHTLTSPGSRSFILKMDEDWNFLWAHAVHPTGQPLELAIGGDGSVYCTGHFVLQVDFDPGPETHVLTAQDHDGFAAKFSPEGDFVWVRSFGGVETEYSTAITIDDADNIYLMTTHESDADYDPSTVQYIFPGGGVTALKLDSDGNFVWAKNFEINNPSFESNYITSNSSLIYLVMAPRETIDADPNESVHTMVNPVGKHSLFVIGLDLQGNLQHTYQMEFDNTNYFQYNVGLDVDPNSLILSSDFRVDGDLDPSSPAGSVTSNGLADAIIVRLDLPQLDVVENINELFSIYPNPSSGWVTITSGEAAEVALYDIVGRYVSSFTLTAGENVINMASELADGTYFLKSGAWSAKLLVRK